MTIEIKQQIFKVLELMAIERVGLNAARIFGFGSQFTTAVIILTKGDTYEEVSDARILTAITDFSKYRILFLPNQVLILRN